MIRVAASPGVLVGLVCLSTVSAAQCIDPVQAARLESPPSPGGTHMGDPLAVDPNADPRGDLFIAASAWANAGAVNVYQRQGAVWQFHSQLTASDAQPGDHFGNALAMSGRAMVVGAYGANASSSITDSGKAYVFELENGVWVERQRLLLDAPATNDFFGYVAAIDGTTLLISDALGRVQVYDRVAGVWTRTQQLRPDGTFFFGQAMAIRGDTAAISDTAGTHHAGRVFIYTRPDGPGGQWVLRDTLEGPEPATDNYFGAGIALENNTLLVGQVRTCTGCTSFGRVFAFTRTQFDGPWSLQGAMFSTEPQNEDLFGLTLALRGNLAVVGAVKANGAAGTQSGAARVYTREGGVWRYRDELHPFPHQAGDRFGGGVGIIGRAAVVGADSLAANERPGYVTVFALTACPPDFNCDGFLDFFDYDAFVLAFETGDESADFNGDGFLDFFDYDEYVAAYEDGC